MTKNVMGFVRGLGVGIAVGSVAGIMSRRMMPQHKKGVKDHVGKALRNVGELVDNVSQMF